MINENGQEYSAITELSAGLVPSDCQLVRELSTGIEFITDFWRDRYFREYIKEGGSKIKFVTGQTGSGKTHLLSLMEFIARDENYITASFSANDIWIHDFREIYVEVLNRCDILNCLKSCSCTIIRSLGFDPADIPEGMTFMDYLAGKDLSDAITRREIRIQLKEMFLKNPLLDNNFALACSLLTGGLLGHPMLEEPNKELLLGWLTGDKTVKLASLRVLGLSPSRITKFNARHMLRSLAEIIRLSGHSGLVVMIDNMEILINKSSLAPVHYTKLKREDTYESIRQLIDDIDSMKNIMFFLAFDRELIDDENAGVKSYQALWMRIQNEVSGEHFNRFSDIVDLDKMAEQVYTPDIIVRMSEKLAGVMNGMQSCVRSIDLERSKEIIAQSKLSKLSIPKLVNRATIGGEGSV